MPRSSPASGPSLGGLSDGWKAYIGALGQVLGRVRHRRRRGSRGRQPKPILVPPADLFYGQVVKVRDATGPLGQVVRRVIFGGPRRFFRQLAERGLGQTIQTAFMERGYRTLRGLRPPLRRRTRWGSARVPRHRGWIWLFVDLYNFVLPHKSLCWQGHPRTPAMALGVANHGWSYRESMGHPVHPDPRGRYAMGQRIQELLIPALEPS